MTLTLPDEPVLTALGEDELRLQLACAMYFSRSISRGLGAKLAGMEVDHFEAELYARNVSNGQTPASLDEDLAVMAKLLAA